MKFFKLKRILIVLSVLIIAFFAYVEIVNRDSKNMTYRQKILKAIYPAFIWWTNLVGKKAKNPTGFKAPVVSFYELKEKLNNGDTLDFANLKGKKIMLVNTASDCGYTGQYEDLQRLADKYENKLIVIGFPANDFKNQEKGTDAEIAQFCKINFGVKFLLMEKSVVVKSAAQNPVFQWLTDSTKNGWNNKPPVWNFTKFLVNEKGVLTNYFTPSVSPLSSPVIKAIENQE